MSFRVAWLLLSLAVSGEPRVETLYVLKDGSTVEFGEAPQVKGTTLVGRLSGSGLLVSIPKSQVDEERSAEARKTARPAAKKTPPLVKAKVPLGDRVKLNAPRAEVEKKLQSSQGNLSTKNDPVPERAPAGEKREKEKANAEKAAPAKPDADDRMPDPVDRNGNGEAYWREKAAPKKEELRQAEEALAAAQRRVNEMEVGVKPVTGAEAWAAQLLVARNALDAAKERKQKAEAGLEDLAEEARKAGAYPGWVR